MATYKDDRKFTTSYSDSWTDVKVSGKADAVEFRIAADLCEEHGFELPAKLLREIEARHDYDEPRRKHGWSIGSRCNVYHFFPRGIASGNPACQRRILYRSHNYEWYPAASHYGLCRMCLERLRTIHAKACPAALAAIERLLAEQSESRKTPQ